MYQMETFVLVLTIQIKMANKKILDTDSRLEENLRYANISKKILIGTLTIIIIGCFIFPWIFRYSSIVKSNLTFLNLIQNPFRMNFHNPENYGLMGARNFYLTTPDGETLGVWHMLPVELQAEGAALDPDDPDNDESQADGASLDPNDTWIASRYHEWLQEATVFVYCHGAVGSRANDGRVVLYQLLNRLGYHVIAFDYRGFGDSSGRPMTERDVTVDTRTVLDWLMGYVRGGHIILWGHSLGSGVVAHLLADFESEPDIPIVGAVLESSFNNLLDAIRTYPPAIPYVKLPWFDYFAVEPIANQGLTFRSEEYLKRVYLPLLFLHAHDDYIVPFRLGIKLYESVLSSRKDNSTTAFVGFDKKFGYGHTKIATAPSLGAIVKDFVENCLKRKV